MTDKQQHEIPIISVLLEWLKDAGFMTKLVAENKGEEGNYYARWEVYDGDDLIAQFARVDYGIWRAFLAYKCKPFPKVQRYELSPQQRAKIVFCKWGEHVYGNDWVTRDWYGSEGYFGLKDAVKSVGPTPDAVLKGY